MYFHVTQGNKGFLTNDTNVRSIPRVGFDVVFEGRQLSEPFATIRTLEGFLAGVSPFVDFQLFFLHELLVAMTTRVRLVASVRSHVILQFVF